MGEAEEQDKAYPPELRVPYERKAHQLEQHLKASPMAHVQESSDMARACQFAISLQDSMAKNPLRAKAAPQPLLYMPNCVEVYGSAFHHDKDQHQAAPKRGLQAPSPAFCKRL